VQSKRIVDDVYAAVVNDLAQRFARHALPSGLTVFDSYHCSRQNTNTRRLTTEMFEQVVSDAVASVESRPIAP
jgi:uracil-DNA glycosylase